MASLTIPLDAWYTYAAARLLNHPNRAIRGAAIETILHISTPPDDARALLAPVLTNDTTTESRAGFLGRRTVYPLRQRAWQVLELLDVHTPAPIIETPTVNWRIGRIVFPIIALLASVYALRRYQLRHLPRRIAPALRSRLRRLGLLTAYVGFGLTVAGWLTRRTDIKLDLITSGGHNVSIDSRQGILNFEIDDNWPVRVSDLGGSPAPANRSTGTTQPFAPAATSSARANPSHRALRSAPAPSSSDSTSAGERSVSRSLSSSSPASSTPSPSAAGAAAEPA